MLPDTLTEFLTRGGPVLWLIAALSVITLTLILWKIWQLGRLGAWSGGTVTGAALADWEAAAVDSAAARLAGRSSLRARLALNAMTIRLTAALDEPQAREEIERAARAELHEARRGLRGLELISTTAPLLGLLGTVLGMIAAFQALQEAGSQADPAALAGGIWEALLTTAAGMAVAIPAGVALSWFEGIADRLQADLEDTATRIFIRGPRGGA